MYLELNIAKLIKGRFFHNVFQPLWSSDNDETFAFEALIRTSQNINPETIFEYGRNEGMLFEFDTASISNAIKEFPYSYLQRYLLFINVFPSTIVHPNFIEHIENLLCSYPEIIFRTVFEINESLDEENYWSLDIFAKRLLWLKEHGFKIAFDDFPLTNTTIGLIQKFKPHFVKLDRIYSADLSKSIENQEKIVDLLNSLNRKVHVVLEGIETKEDFQMANQLGVPFLQGYYISRPHRL